jgi:hypothetical protein
VSRTYRRRLVFGGEAAEDAVSPDVISITSVSAAREIVSLIGVTVPPLVVSRPSATSAAPFHEDVIVMVPEAVAVVVGFPGR